MRSPLPILLLMIAALPLAAAPAGTSPAAGEPCALHVWPSSSSAANRGGWLSNMGIAGAMVDYERNKDAKLHDQVALILNLTPPDQARLLHEAGLPDLFGMAGARLVFESGRLEPKSVESVRARRSQSSVSCYAELIVSLNLYQKSAVYGRTLTTRMTFKDFRGGRMRMVSANVRNPAPGFPAMDPGQEDAARRTLASAFTANIRDFASKVRRKLQ